MTKAILEDEEQAGKEERVTKKETLVQKKLTNQAQPSQLNKSEEDEEDELEEAIALLSPHFPLSLLLRSWVLRMTC